MNAWFRPRRRRAATAPDDEPSAWVPPVIIGATGGSGTRVVAEMLARAGFHLGRKLNPALDSMDGKALVREWIPPVLEARAGGAPIDEPAFTRDLERRLRRHREGIRDPGGPWLVKNPRWIYLLPQVNARHPRFRFLHLIRDGRDMAFSDNQAQVKNLGHLVADVPADAPLAVRSIALWGRVNLDAAAFGEASLGERYLRIRFEDLCARSLETARAILDFAGADADPAEAAALVRPPESIGRWRAQDPEVRDAVAAVGRPALDALGYAD